MDDVVGFPLGDGTEHVNGKVVLHIGGKIVQQSGYSVSQPLNMLEMISVGARAA